MNRYLNSLENYPNYTVRKDGSIWSNKTYRRLRSKYRQDQYERVVLRNDFGSKTFMVHRVVAMVFIPNPNNLPYVNHIDLNKRNNNVENLEWISPRENSLHWVRAAKKCKSLRNRSMSILSISKELNIEPYLVKAYLRDKE